MEHEGVAERLDLLGAVLCQQVAHIAAEAAYQVGRVLVAVRLGQGGEAREVSEEEGVAGRRHSSTLGELR